MCLEVMYGRAADGCTFLQVMSRPLPKDGEDARRNEGVGILLDG